MQVQAVDPDTLAKSPLFRRLSEKHSAVSGHRARVLSFRPGAVLWRRGERARAVFVVMHGRIALVGDDGLSNPPVIDVYGPGDLAGASSALLKLRYVYTAKSIDTVYVLRYSMAEFTRMMLRDSRLAVAAVKVIAANWHRLGPHIFELKRFSATQRLAMYLLSHTDRKSGRADIRLGEDQLLIAGILGTTRQSLSRSFAQLRTLGVRKRGRGVVIGDVTRLRKFCRPAAQ
jgi:CRP-like cAMP-binding protein